MDQQAREQAFMNALATELFVLQAARGAIVGEQVGRGGIYMGAVSSALIALGFLAQVVRRLDPFVAAVLPALVVLGEFTFAALVRNSLENLVLLGQMQRIRGYYRGLVPEAGEFFDPPEADVLYQAAVATIGLRVSPAQALFTGASVVAAINSILGGAGVALLAGRVGDLGDVAALTVGGAAAVLLFGLHLGYQQRRVANLRRRSWAGTPLATRPGPPIVSRTGPAPSRRPVRSVLCWRQVAAGRIGRTPHPPHRGLTSGQGSDLDETHGSFARPRCAREPGAR